MLKCLYLTYSIENMCKVRDFRPVLNLNSFFIIGIGLIMATNSGRNVVADLFG